MNNHEYTAPAAFTPGFSLKGYIITMRPYLMFVSGITGVAGMAFGQDIGIFRTLLIFIASFLSYGFGQALTDCFQIDTDSISAPYRPLTRGLISKSSVLMMSITGLILCVGMLMYFNLTNGLLGIGAGAGLATYTWFKRRWWGGPFYNAWIVVLLFLMGFLASGCAWSDSMNIPFFAAAAAVFFGYSNFVLSGYFKDIEADRATGYHTLPVVAGRKISAVISDCFACLTVVASFISMAFLMQLYPVVSPGAVVFFAAGTGTAVIAQVRLHRVRTDRSAHRAITPVLFSYLFLLSGIASAQHNSWNTALAVFCCAFILVLGRRPAAEQV